VAISAISLLKSFMTLGQAETFDSERIKWLLLLHLTFVVSGLLFAAMDWVADRAHSQAH
jgi:uncharacterized protein (TIGR00645 family)